MRKQQCVCGGISAGLFLIGAGLLIAGLVVVLKVFPDTVNKTVKSQKVLGMNTDGTLNDFTKTWANPSYISTMQYWAFDYKNTIGILNRALQPDMDEKGPYTYDETIINSRISFIDNGEKMQFAQATQYNFNPAKSCPTCDPKKDTVTVPDISFFVGLQQIDSLVETLLGNEKIEGICKMLLKDKCAELAEVLEREIGTVMSMFKTGPFVTVTVDQLLFSGYISPLITKLADRVIKISNKLIGTNFPLIDPKPFTVALNAENGTTDTLYTVDSGKLDYSRAGYILSFNNMTNASLPSQGNKLPSQWWPGAETPSCNGYALMLEGTDGDFFKSFIEKTERLPIYIDDICRTAELQFEKEVTVKDIQGYRFVMPADQFDYSLTDNCGFCNPNTLSKYGAYDRPVNSTCLPSGLLDISGCQNSPIIISKPHFYQASDIVKSFVPRFKSSYDDETTLDIEPMTGTVLSANKRIQINLLANQFPTIGAYSVLRPGAYPLVWLNESFLMDDGTRDDLQSSLFTPTKIVKIACWSAVGVGGLEATYCEI
ncbi:CD36 family protein [Ancylostoma ceylanicum]|uniref:CD36 family protein n=1 Tax=Ancylostoma ceylanicum TaxID=53326 RepID=A0A0D6LMV3_9BILA|nr:CD36 family protein [Ancylostoma ceylanicum]